MSVEPSNISTLTIASGSVLSLQCSKCSAGEPISVVTDSLVLRDHSELEVTHDIAAPKVSLASSSRLSAGGAATAAAACSRWRCRCCRRRSIDKNDERRYKCLEPFRRRGAAAAAAAATAPSPALLQIPAVPAAALRAVLPPAVPAGRPRTAAHLRCRRHRRRRSPHPPPPPPSPPSTEIKLFTSDLNVDRSSIVEGVGSVHVDGDATLDGQVTNQGASRWW